MKYAEKWDRQKEEEIQQRFAQGLFREAARLEAQQKKQPRKQAKK